MKKSKWEGLERKKTEMEVKKKEEEEEVGIGIIRRKGVRQD